MEYSISVNEVYNKGNILGYASVVFDGSFRVNNIAIMLNNRTGEWFVSMPSFLSSEKDENGKAVYKSVCNPITADFRSRLYEDILKAFHDTAQGLEMPEKSAPSASESGTVRLPKFEVKVTPFERENSKVRAFVRIVLDGSFAINNARLVQARDGLFLSMPYYSRPGEAEDDRAIFQDICYPTTKEFRKLLQSTAVKEYNRQRNEKQSVEQGAETERQTSVDRRSYRKAGRSGRHR